MLLASTPCFAEGVEVESTEENDRYARLVVTVEVPDNSFESHKGAFAEAKEEALVLWLESTLGTLKTSEEKYFLNRLSSYVSNTEITKETPLVGGGALDVEVMLDTHTLRFDAASLLFPKRMTPVPTLFIMGEFVEGSDGYSARQGDVAPFMLRELFKKSGFKVFSAAEVRRNFSHDDLLVCLQGGPKAAIRLGRALNAEVIIFGETKSVSETSETSGRGGVRGLSDVMVIRVSDGQLLERIKTDAKVEGSDIHANGLMAIEDAVYKAQNRILVAAALGSLTPPERTWVRLTIEGDNVRNVSESLTKHLDSLEVIESLELLHRKRNEVIYSVNYAGKISALVTILSDKTQRSIRLEPIKIVDEEMTFHLVGY